jgi:hypothetical protein
MLQRIDEGNDYLTHEFFWWGHLSHFEKRKDTQRPHLGIREPMCCFREWEGQP